MNIHLKIVQKVNHLLAIFQNETNSLSFSSSLLVNSEPIEQNLKGIFANKNGKI
jgi:hypothetical protein